jgi:hypothetical protein
LNQFKAQIQIELDPPPYTVVGVHLSAALPPLFWQQHRPHCAPAHARRSRAGAGPPPPAVSSQSPSPLPAAAWPHAATRHPVGPRTPCLLFPPPMPPPCAAVRPRAPRSSASRAAIRAGPSPPLLVGVRHRHAMPSTFLAVQPDDKLPHPGQVTIPSSVPPALRSRIALTELRSPVSHPSVYATSALIVTRRSPPPRLLAFDHRPEAWSHCRRTPERFRRATPSREEPSPPPLIHRLPVQCRWHQSSQQSVLRSS